MKCLATYAALLVGATATTILSANAMMASPASFTETQPDGRVVTLKINGDPYDAWMSDPDGYTVVRDPQTGRFVYAEPDGNGGLKASDEVVVDVHPHGSAAEPTPNTASASSYGTGGAADGANNGRVSIIPSVRASKKQKRLRPDVRDCDDAICGDDDDDDKVHRRSAARRQLRGALLPSAAASAGTSHLPVPSVTRTLQPTTGTLRNLVVLLRWSDHDDRKLPTLSDVDTLMNHEGPHPLCPTGSVRDVFLENSYGSLVLESTVIDWIPMDNTEDYYSNGNRGVTTKIRQGIRYALKYLDDNNLVDFSYFDGDDDGVIDSITFLHSGYGAEWGGTDSNGRFYEERIWSHQWSLPGNGFVSNDGTTVRLYHISPSVWGTRGSAMGRIGVIAHETGHFLGMPDLYDVDGGGSGIGTYCLMANSWGFDGSQYYPPHMSALVKVALGWVEPVEATPGRNLIEASELQDPSLPQVYRISQGFPEGEFLLIENRQRIGFDSKMPQGGLVIWHVDYTTDPASNFITSLSNEGHPWQQGWPSNGKHYGIALVQADGLYDLEQGINAGDSDDVFHGAGVNELVPCITAGDCQYPNTDSYQSGNVAPTNVYITGISVAQNIMTFNFGVGGRVDMPTSAPRPSEPSTPAPSMAPAILSTTEDQILDPNSSATSISMITLRVLTFIALVTTVASVAS